ncbi:MAG TPA: DsbA family protein [Acidimicrobiales bacterium]|nr:DsbA family protein [Acidimicrobiales bacterium]
MTEVTFHFDVMCPWAYQTSVWVREAAAVRDLRLRWAFFSLEEVNLEAGKPHPWERAWPYGWSMLRVAAGLRRRGDELVDRFYAAAGAALHVEGRPVQRREVLEEVMAAAGLDLAVIDEVLADPTIDDEIRADHQRVLDLGGFGVPTMVLDGTTTLFGPVVAPAPSGEAAGRLWDLVAGWGDFPHLYELRRPKTQADWDHIGATFQPYLDARSWRTIEHPVA